MHAHFLHVYIPEVYFFRMDFLEPTYIYMCVYIYKMYGNSKFYSHKG